MSGEPKSGSTWVASAYMIIWALKQWHCLEGPFAFSRIRRRNFNVVMQQQAALPQAQSSEVRL